MIRFYKKISSFNWQYAIGEISLIFIGITLALWFNNWNTNSQNKAKEDQYISNLYEDLTSDVNEYKFLIKANEERIRKINLLNEVVEHLDESLNCDSIQTYIASASFINVFTGSATVFEDLKSTGNLLLIRNNELKRKILKYYEKVNSRKKYEDLNTRFHINTIGSFLKKEWNTGGMFRIGMNELGINNQFRKDDCRKTLSRLGKIRKDEALTQEFFNHTNFSYFIIQMNNNEYKILMQEAKGLMEMIQKN